MQEERVIQRMREYKYKAKRIDSNEWVEGYFWQNECGNYFIRVTFEHNKIIIKDYEIDPETICEFTGKIGSNNKKIYQNDIVAFWIGDKLIYKILVWYNEMGYMTAVPIDGIQGNKIIGYYSLRYPYYTYETFCSMFKDTDYSKIEVIGNFVDNPELLEGNND